MGPVSRIVERLIGSEVPLCRDAFLGAARVVAAEEAPLDHRAAAGAVEALTGLGPLEGLLADPDVSDVLVNGPGEVWVERLGRLKRTDVEFPDPASVVAAVERVIAPLGLRIDRASPAVDARLPDGSRLHAVIPPASVDGPVVAIRRFVPAVADLAGFEAAGSISANGVGLLREAVRSRSNLLVSGGTGSGKTTLLNVLSRERRTEPLPMRTEAATEPGSGVPPEIGGGQALPDGYVLVDRVGRLVRDADGWRFAFASGGGAPTDAPVRILPSRLLETMEHASAGGTEHTTFVLSGEVVAYRGRSFLLLRKVLIRRGLGNLR